MKPDERTVPAPQDPGERGPEQERVGEDDENEGGRERKEPRPARGPEPTPAATPEPGAPDANPIDPRVF